MASTDLEVGVRCQIRAEIVKEGSLTVPAKPFGEFIRTLGEDQDIKINTEDLTRMEIRCGKTRCVLLGLPKEDFPILPEFPEEKSITLEGKVLQEMIKKTAFASSTDETRYILNGIYFKLEKGTATMVATDGRRLSFIARPLEGNKLQTAAIVPSKAMAEVERLLSSESGNAKVQVSITDNQVAFKIGDTVIISRLIEGNFPNYDQVIPKNTDIQVKVSTRYLLTMTQRAALGSGDRGGAIRFALEKDRLRATGSAQGRVEVEDEIPMEYSGKPFEIAFNPVFMLDVLKNIDSADVFLEFTSSLNPGVVRPANDERMICVIMPMRA